MTKGGSNQDLRIVVGATGQLSTIVARNKLSSSTGGQSLEPMGNRVSMFAEYVIILMVG